ncbi:helix-turn-helix domain-containing protein [Actinoplanes sp. CA-142083]|uniref:helix-turn-helix domain-containing protein n=1 Tax=Actinoplanes sp. CA-142083 TaxID=3239903 RepID=UPI003D8B7950
MREKALPSDRIADKAHVSRSSLDAVITGRRVPTPGTLRRIIAAIGDLSAEQRAGAIRAS